MTYKQAAQQALDIQDACNLSGVAFAFANAVQAVCDESHKGGATGTEWRNTHPIITMHLLKMCELNGCGSTLHESYNKAEKQCQQIARDGITIHDLANELRPAEKDPTCVFCDTGEPHEH